MRAEPTVDDNSVATTPGEQEEQADGLAAVEQTTVVIAQPTSLTGSGVPPPNHRAVALRKLTLEITALTTALWLYVAPAVSHAYTTIERSVVDPTHADLREIEARLQRAPN